MVITQDTAEDVISALDKTDRIIIDDQADKDWEDRLSSVDIKETPRQAFDHPVTVNTKGVKLISYKDSDKTVTQNFHDNDTLVIGTNCQKNTFNGFENRTGIRWIIKGDSPKDALAEIPNGANVIIGPGITTNFVQDMDLWTIENLWLFADYTDDWWALLSAKIIELTTCVQTLPKKQRISLSKTLLNMIGKYEIVRKELHEQDQKQEGFIEFFTSMRQILNIDLGREAYACHPHGVSSHMNLLAMEDYYFSKDLYFFLLHMTIHELMQHISAQPYERRKLDLASKMLQQAFQLQLGNG